MLSANFLSLTSMGLLTSISPGPNFAIVLKNSLENSRSAGLRTAWGIGAAGLCRTVLTIVCIAHFMPAFNSVLNTLKFVGAFYLLYLGSSTLYGSFRQPLPTSTLKSNIAPRLHSVEQGFFSGFFCSLLNPKAWMVFSLLFASMFPLKSSFGYKLGCGLWIIGLNTLWFMSVACFFTLPCMQKRLRQIKNWLERCTGVVLILFGLKLFVTPLLLLN